MVVYGAGNESVPVFCLAHQAAREEGCGRRWSRGSAGAEACSGPDWTA